MRNHDEAKESAATALAPCFGMPPTAAKWGESDLKRQITGVCLLFALLLPQFGCSTADVVGSHVLKQFLKDDPTIVEATVIAAADVNPDARGRPSPIKVRFYLLKSPKVFQNTDFFTLKEQGRELLVDDLRLYDEKVFKPGAITIVELKLPPEETLEDEQLFLGIVAGYWNLDQATWQLVHEIEVHDTTEMTIALDRTAVSMKPAE